LSGKKVKQRKKNEIKRKIVDVNESLAYTQLG
jgi:hypothetical protein